MQNSGRVDRPRPDPVIWRRLSEFVPSLIVAQQFRPQFGTYRRNLKVKAVAVIKTEQGLTGEMGADGG